MGNNFSAVEGPKEEFTDEEKKYMKRALKLAEKGAGRVSPNPMVGAVIVKNGSIIGEGYHEFYGGPHAEVNALKDAGKEAPNSDIYVTLEPCSHYGKTPPCADKLINVGIKKAVIAVVDPNPEVAGRGIEKLRSAGIEVKVGLYADKAKNLNEAFIKYITSEYPFVYLKKAQTLDGYTAASTGDSKWITNFEARQEGHKIRHRADAVMVGIGTVLADNPSLTTRLKTVEGERGAGIDSLRIVLDSKLKIPLESKLINQQSQKDTLIICSDKLDQKSLQKKEKLHSKKGVEIQSFKLNQNKRLPLADILIYLHKRKIASILLEGGAELGYSFLKENFVDKLYYFVAPKLYGGDDGISAFTGKGPELMKDALDLNIEEFKRLGDNYLFVAKID